MFNRMLNAFGIGGPSVDTVLDSPHGVPGQAVTGQVRIQGGGADAEIGQVVLSLVTHTETELVRLVVQQGVRVPAGQLVSVPFQLPLPWETPITAVGGAALPGISVGVRTELVIAGSADKGDLDTVLVGPLPSQNKVLDAFGQLGFSFRGTDLEAGRLPGVPQELGFYQEIEFFPPAQFAGRLSEVELKFVANANELHVVLEADKNRGTFSAGGDTSGHMRVSHQEAQVTDWTSAINGWLAQVSERGLANPAFGHNPAFGGYGNQNAAFSNQNAAFSNQNAAFSNQNAAFGNQPAAFSNQNAAFGNRPVHNRHGYDHDAHGQRRGPGMGGMLAAGAAGVVGGMVLGGVAEEFFGDDEG